MTLTGVPAAFSADETENENYIEEIIVTSERGDTNVLDRAMTVTGFSEGMIEKLGIQNADDMVVMVPGLEKGNRTQGGGKSEDGHYVMRGIGNDRVNAFYQDVSVAYYIDGVYTNLSYATDSTFDMERVEVTRGPQGTTGGKASIAGAITGPELVTDAAMLCAVSPASGSAAAMRAWAEGECLVFDDSIEHEVWHDGARPRGATPEADKALEAELLADPKERAEHLMLLDLGRNDVGRVAAPGTVEVTESFVVERYSQVMHIVSNVRGKADPKLDAVDTLLAALPAGTLSGAPKVRAMSMLTVAGSSGSNIGKHTYDTGGNTYVSGVSGDKHNFGVLNDGFNNGGNRNNEALVVCKK